MEISHFHVEDFAADAPAVLEPLQNAHVTVDGDNDEEEPRAVEGEPNMLEVPEIGFLDNTQMPSVMALRLYSPTANDIPSIKGRRKYLTCFKDSVLLSTDTCTTKKAFT